MPLLKVLAAFQAQSGNAIVDCRREFGQPTSDPALKVDFDKTPFWPALDQVLDQAGLASYLYANKGALGVVAGSGKKGSGGRARVSYSGPLRLEAASVFARRDLRSADGDRLFVTVDAAWEPRLRVISLFCRAANICAVDERGAPLPVEDGKVQEEVPVPDETTGVELNVPLMLPPRSVQRIASLKGRLIVMMAGKVETFRFAQLESAKNVKQRIAGVTVTLEQVQKSAAGGRAKDATWEVRLRVQFDDAGDALASHRQWIFNNEARLEAPTEKQSLATASRPSCRARTRWAWPTHSTSIGR